MFGEGEETGSFPLGSETWSYRHRLYIDNPNTSQLPSGYSLKLVVDTAALVSAGKLLASGDDLRLVWTGGGEPARAGPRGGHCFQRRRPPRSGSRARLPSLPAAGILPTTFTTATRLPAPLRRIRPTSSPCTMALMIPRSIPPCGRSLERSRRATVGRIYRPVATCTANKPSPMACWRCASRPVAEEVTCGGAGKMGRPTRPILWCSRIILHRPTWLPCCAMMVLHIKHLH